MADKIQVADGEAEIGTELWCVEGDTILSGRVVDLMVDGWPRVTLSHGCDGRRLWPAASCYLRPWLSLSLGDDPARGYGLARRCYVLLSQSFATLRRNGTPQAVARAAKAVEIAEARAAVAFFAKVKAARPLTAGQTASAAEWRGILDELVAEAMAEPARNRGAA